MIKAIFWILSALCAGLIGSATLAAPSERLPVVSWDQFKTWDKSTQATYVKELRLAYAELAKAANAGLQFARLKPQTPWLAILPYAHAEEAAGYCIVGGVLLTTYDTGEKTVCPTFGRGCPQLNDGFMCGKIYGKASGNGLCVERQPVDSISDRCEKGAQPLSEEEYNSARKDLQAVAKRCESNEIDPRFHANCQRYLERLKKLDGQFAKTNISADPSPEATAETSPVSEVEEQASVVQPPAQITKLASKSVPPTPSKKKKQDPTKLGCLDRNRAALGSLACVACSIEESAPAEVPNQNGVSNWISLLGIMARQTADVRSNDDLQMRVAEMVASYGYCTNDTYDIHPDDKEARNWMDGKNFDQKKFAKSYGLNADKTSFLKSGPDNKNEPLRYVKSIFKDHDWDKGNPQNRQWRFQSLITKHAESYKKTPFSSCARAINENLKKKPFQMCTRKNGKLASTTNMKDNNELFARMQAKCGFKAQRKIASNTCYNECINSPSYKRVNWTNGNCRDSKSRTADNKRGGKTGSSRGNGPSGPKGDEDDGATHDPDPDPETPDKPGESTAGTRPGPSYDGNSLGGQSKASGNHGRDNNSGPAHGHRN